MQDVERQPEPACAGRLQVAPQGLGIGIGRVYQERNEMDCNLIAIAFGPPC